MARFARFCVVLCLSALGASCGLLDSHVTIGFTALLSGRSADIGTRALRGAEAAAAYFNDSGGVRGREIRLSVADNLGTADGLTAAFDSIQADGATVVVGPIFSSMAEPLIEAMAGRDLIVVSQGMSTTYMSGLDDNFFRTVADPGPQGRVPSRYFREQALVRLALVRGSANRRLSEEIGEAFITESQTWDAEVLVNVWYDEKSMGWLSDLANEITEAGVEGVLVVSNALDSAIIAQALRKANPRIQLFCVSQAMTDEFVRNGGLGAEGTKFVNFAPGIEGPVGGEFARTYRSLFADDPDFIAELTFNAFAVVVDGLRRSRPMSAQNLRRALLSDTEYSAIGGAIRLDEFGDTTWDHRVFELRDGEFVKID